jgi:heavy metal sensor kinase
MKWYSVRVRLTLWNIAILALVLGGFGLTLCTSVAGNLQASGDRELVARARQFAEWQERRDPSRPRRHHGWGRGPSPGAGATKQAGSGPSAAASNAASERFNSFRFPRLLSLDGKPLFSFLEDEPWDPDTFALSREGAERFSTVLVDREEARVFSMPFRRNGRIEGVIQVAYPIAEQKRLIEGQVQTLLTLLPLALLVAGMGGIFLTDRALRPVREVTQAAEQLGARDLSRRLEVAGRDEMAHLATTFNGMLARLDASFEQQRRFTADASHELRTPLARLKVTTSLALSGRRSAEEYRDALEVADRTADAMSEIVQDLLLLARSDAGELRLEARPASVEELLHGAIAGIAGLPGPVPRLDAVPRGLTVLGDARHLVRLFRNLLENAVRHTPPDGTVTVSAWEDGGNVRIRVRDTGEGILPEHLAHVTERFYRIDTARSRSRGGTGLGLAICQSIVHAQGGEMEIESEIGRGTVVTVLLPSGPTLFSAPAPPAEEAVSCV